MPWYINKVMPTIFANFAFVVISLLVAWHVTKNLRNQQTDNTETPLTANASTSPTTINNKTDTVNTTTDISNL